MEFQKLKKLVGKNKLSMSELITILIEGHRRNFITEKQLYELALGELRSCFKQVPCYVQFTRAIRKTMPYLDLLLEVFTRVNAHHETQLYIIDSTSLPVAGYERNKVKWALDSAGIGHNMHGRYQGFKLHIIVNQNREVVSVATTPANVHDIQVLKNESFIKHINGILVGDKGYIASDKHRKYLRTCGIKLLAKQRKNMDPYLNHYYKMLFNKRKKIESIFSYLKIRMSAIFPFVRTAQSFLVNTKSLSENSSHLKKP
jgi:hypothetical protein